MNERDLRDSSRAVAPAKPAQDAVRLDTTYMTADQAFAAAARIAEDKLGS
jgi:cytidylate kinase